MIEQPLTIHGPGQLSDPEGRVDGVAFPRVGVEDDEPVVIVEAVQNLVLKIFWVQESDLSKFQNHEITI